MSTQLHNIKDVAAMFQVSTRTIHNLISRGDLIPTRIGTRLLFHADEIDRFAREPLKSIKNAPVDRQELDTYINTLGEGSPLHYVMTAYRDRIDGKPIEATLAFDTAIRLTGPLVSTVETKIGNRQERTTGERLALKYVALALSKFSEAA